ncbi:MAG: hypothetical protein RI885_1189 [Actinomycetota bacterium]
MLDDHGDITFPGIPVVLTFDAATDLGAVRRLNEDSFIAAPPIFAVADGMGGHAFGDRASRVVVEAFATAFGVDAPASADGVLDVIRSANRAVVSLTADTPDVVSGTTLAGLAFVSVGRRDTFHWMAFNIGDSRVYRWDGRTLTQLTVDHSAVQELVDDGAISRADAAAHPDRNVVTRALGAEGEVDPDVWLLPATGRQRFLVCSDGLTRELSDDEIARVLVFHEGTTVDADEPITLSQRLVGAAIAAGGSDNVTVISVESVMAPTAVAAPTTSLLAAGARSAGAPRELEDTSPRR